MSKYLGEVYTDLKNPMTPGLIIDLGRNPSAEEKD
jgi:hypothetical protein